MFTANDRNDHVTMFTLYVSLAVFSFSIELSSFAVNIIGQNNREHK